MGKLMMKKNSEKSTQWCQDNASDLYENFPTFIYDVIAYNPVFIQCLQLFN